MEPTSSPLFTHLLAQEYAELSKTPKPTALNTMLRYSGAMGCGRQMGYVWFDAEFSEQPTAGSLWQALVGTIIGKYQAEAMMKEFGGEAEKPSQVNGWISGSADWFCMDTPLGVTVYEHKMKSAYAFNKALGYKRSFGKISLSEPGGPPRDAVVQAGMNALGIERTYNLHVDAVVVGVVSTDIVTVNELKQVAVADLARFSAEWVIPRETWEPMALAEIDRLGQFAETMDLGYIPDRIALDDNGERVFLTPGGKNWRCDYCNFVGLCKSDGEGQIRVLDSKMTRRIDLAHFNPLESNEADSDAFIDFLLEKENSHAE